jgi:hypothetical protein
VLSGLHQEQVTADELLIWGKADASEIRILGDGEKCVVPNGGELSADGLEVWRYAQSGDERRSRHIRGEPELDVHAFL